jgi:hypothetical protein
MAFRVSFTTNEYDLQFLFVNVYFAIAQFISVTFCFHPELFPSGDYSAAGIEHVWKEWVKEKGYSEQFLALSNWRSVVGQIFSNYQKCNYQPCLRELGDGFIPEKFRLETIPLFKKGNFFV